MPEYAAYSCSASRLSASAISAAVAFGRSFAETNTVDLDAF
jgi:hypothetical protein